MNEESSPSYHSRCGVDGGSVVVVVGGSTGGQVGSYGGRWWLCVLFALVIVLSLSGGVLAAGSYPGGSRNTAEWYFCYSDRQSTSGSWTAWSDMVCEHIMWQNPGGTYRSVNMEMGLQSGDANTGAQIVGYVVPPVGVKTYNYHCNGNVSRQFVNATITGSSSGVASTTGTASNPFNGDDTEFSFGYPSNVVGNSTFTTVFDVVGLWRASQEDNFSSLEPVTGWGADPPSTYPHYHLSSSTDTSNRLITVFLSCWVYDWLMWGSTPEWTPGAGDYEPTPTGTVTPVPTATPDPNAWVPFPWVPITSTVNAPNFDFTAPITDTCYTIIPSIEISPTSTTGVEFCVAEWDVSLNVMGYDLGAALLVAFSLAAAGILFGILKGG